MARQVRCAFAMIGLAVAALAPAVARADFDSRLGVVVSDDAAFAYGFEGAPIGREVIAWQGDDILPAVQLAPRFTRAEAIEGEGALRIGGGVDAVHIDASVWPADLVGRRVEIRLWVLPRGTDVEAQVWWASGDPWPGLSQEPYSGTFVARMILFPSGRATDDGWIELTSGAVDFAFGGRLAPETLSLFDGGFDGARTEFAAAPDPDGGALIDGFEIIDRGPALVPDARCHLPRAEAQCGAEGVCLFGRCVDGSAAIGPTLPDGLRAAVVERRAFELFEFNGARTIGARRADLGARFGALVGEPVGHRFWTELQAIYSDSGDGHAAGPLPAFNTGASDICTAPGLADRLPDSPELPLVYRTGGDPIADLIPGDAIERIDGMAPLAWLGLTRRYMSVQGDPAAFDIDAGRSLFDLAALTGAEVQVARCPAEMGCAADTLRTIEVDLTAPWDDLWADAGDETGNSLLCDYRLGQYGLNGHSSVASRDEGPARVLAINGVPGDSRRWRERVAEALDDDPELVILDQRVGFGGQDDAVAWVLERLLPEGFAVGYASHPTAGAWDGMEAYRAFATCLAATDDLSFFDCGTADGATVVGRGAAPRKVAVLGGAVISGNEYLLRMLQARDGIRVFAPAPTIGGFGWVLDMPSLVGEVSGGRMQLVDTWFLHREPAVFDTGLGIPPDERVVYRQSDILAGRDTFVEAALAWLTEEDQ